MDAGSSRRHEEHVCLIILIPTVISLCEVLEPQPSLPYGPHYVDGAVPGQRRIKS